VAHPFSILFLFSAIISSVLALSGCAPQTRAKTPAAAAAANAATLEPRVVGEVAVVDEEKHFVLVDLESNLYVPAPGTALRATNANGGVAHLKASPEQKRPFVAADIIDGDPSVGDQVVR
jgi:hypothetical protein